MVSTSALRGVLLLLFTFALLGAPARAQGSADFEWLDCVLSPGPGSPAIGATGALRAGGSVDVRIQATPGQFCALIIGTQATVPGVKFGGGEVVPSGQTLLLEFPLNGVGIGVQTFGIQDAPSSIYLQAVTLDGAGKYRFSNAIGSNRGHQWVAGPSSPDWSDRTEHGVAVLGNYLYLIAGDESGKRTNGVHRFDGSKWVRLLADQAVVSNRFARRSEAGVTSHAGKLWVGFGEGSSGDLNDLWSSSNGTTWVRETANAQAQGGPGLRRNAAMVSFAGKLWVLGGYHRANLTQKPTSIYLNEVWSYDTTSKAWSMTIAPWQGREDLVAVEHRGRLYVVGGNSVVDDSVPFKFESLNDTWSTADGVTWRLETAEAGFVPIRDHAVASFDGELRLFGGFLNTFNYQWRSGDGSGWNVPLELGGPGYNFGNQPIPSAAKDAMPDLVRYDAVGAVFKGRLWSIGGYTVTASPFNPVAVSD